eukprot:gene9679-13032_t
MYYLIFATLLCVLVLGDSIGTPVYRAVLSPFASKPSSQTTSNDKTISFTAKSSPKLNAQLVNFISGGLAGTISSTLTFPLEIIKTQLQSSRLATSKANPVQVLMQIIKDEGPKGLFRGLKPMLVGIIPTRAIYFWAYTSSKGILYPKLGQTPFVHLLSAFAAGITSNTITNPLWMVKTRFQILPDISVGQVAFKNYGEVIKAIMKEEGVSGFFKGLSASYVGCFEGAIQWICYEELKSILSHTNFDNKKLNSNINSDNNNKNYHNLIDNSQPKITSLVGIKRNPSTIEFFFAAAFSKFVAICATYPHEVVRTRLREQATNGAFKYSGFVNTLQRIAKEEGISGLYGGLSIHLLRSVPNAAIMFVSFELVSRWLEDPT